MATNFYARNSYIGDGTTKTFSITFPYFDKGHLHVTVDGVETIEYTLPTESSFTLNQAPSSGAVVTIYRETPKDRFIDFQNGSILNADTLDNDSNQMMYLVQEAADSMNNVLELDIDNKYDAKGRIIKNVGDPVEGTDYLNYGTALNIKEAAKLSEANALASEQAAGLSEANAAQSEANALASEQAAAISESNASTSETNASTSETNAANSASAASTSETNAANSASAASTSETNAANSASAASTSEINAANSASAASTSETNAAISETNASTSESNALTSELKAQKWAEEQEDVEVEVGKYSAKHWATKAQLQVTDIASNISLDTSISQLTANNVKEAIDEIITNFKALGDIDLQGNNLVNVGKVIKTNEIFGLRWFPSTDSYERLGDSIGLSVSNSGLDGVKTSDFDSKYPYSEMRRCNISDTGEVLAYYGEPAYMNDGTNGQVMVEVPKFYYKINSNTNNYEWLISKEQVEGFELHPAFIREGKEKEKIYVSAFEAYSNGGVLESKAGVQPTTGKTRGTFRTEAQARGLGWELLDYYTAFAVQILALIEYGTFDFQRSIGKGIVDKASGTVNESENTGATTGNSSYGNISDGLTHVSYRGIENFWGNTWCFIDGINIRNHVPYVSNHNFQDDVFSGDYTSLRINLPTTNGYQSDIDPQTLLPTVIAGSDSTYITDYFYQGTGDRVALLGGSWSSGWMAGGFYWVVADSSSYSSRYVSSRLLFVG